MFSADQSRVHLTWTWPCGHAGAEARITPVADSPHRKPQPGASLKHCGVVIAASLSVAAGRW